MKVPRTKESVGSTGSHLNPKSSIRRLSVPIRPLSLASLLDSRLGSVREDDPGNNVAAVISLNEHFILGQCEDVQKSDRVSMYPKPATLVVSISQKHDTFVTTREPTLRGCY